MTGENIIWAAGLFEGEGCFSISKKTTKQGYKRDYFYPTIFLKMNDPEPVVKFAKIFDLNVHKGIRRDGNDFYYVATTGTKVTKIGNLLYPFLSSRRRKRFDEIQKMI